MAEEPENCVKLARAVAVGGLPSRTRWAGLGAVLDFLVASLVQFRNVRVAFYEVLPLQ